MVGDGFDFLGGFGLAEVHGAAVHLRDELPAVGDLEEEMGEVKLAGAEQEQQLGEPVDEQFGGVGGLQFDFEDGALFCRETALGFVEGAGGVGEEFLQRAAVNADADVGGVLEELEGFHGWSFQLSAFSSQLAAFGFQLSARSSQLSAFSFQLSAFSSQPSAFSLQLSAFSFQLSVLSLQLSALSFQPSALSLQMSAG